jgi:hypothetical protein
MRFAKALAWVGLGVLTVAAGSAKADTLALTKTVPDITASFVSVVYTASSGNLHIVGAPTGYDLNGVAPVDFSFTGTKSFTIDLTLNQSTGKPISGSLSVIGNLPSGVPGGPFTGSELTGNISQFGFQNSPGGNSFQFVFSTTGGNLQPAFGPYAGVLLDAVDSNFNGTFTSDFANSGFVGSADAFPVPTPAALPAGCVLLGALVLRNRLKRRAY